MAEEEIAVTIDQDEDDTVTVETQEKKSDTTDQAVAELKAQHQEMQRRSEADAAARASAERAAADARREADAARREAATARSGIVDSQLDTVTSGLSAAESEATAAEQAYAASMDAGNFAEAAKAQRRMARAEAEAVRLAEAKADLEARKATPDTHSQTQQARSQSDLVEEYISKQTEPTQRWLRDHRDWITDPKKNAKLTAAHWNAVADDLTPDTDAYFSSVETSIGLRSNGSAKPARRSGATVAPVGAAGNGGRAIGGNEVTLTRREADAATDGTHVWNYDDPSGQKRFKKGEPIGIQEFARRKREMKKQGLYDKSYVEQ